ncbi:hypothetical protein [Streptomyces griseorubiginosus]|uniref:hypothetical protein n=1 Tax=Streptomyces griseorubiginosus TaxID=67304 RepID=UPI002E80F9CC|nr:hypothetical protein [Streptomyces griseorubiginosus]WUB58782.1 hypothetical protein OG942_43880 [Streptomyces griseorubiginosus]
MTTYSASYQGDQWEIRKVSLDPETMTPETVLMEPDTIAGPTAYWPDGTTSYVLAFKGGPSSWTIADEAETAIAALEAIQSGEEIGKELLQAYTRGVRQLEMRLTALKEELLLYAREPGPSGKARLTFRELGDELRQHHTTVAERHQRIVDGDTADWRRWVTHNTDRAALYVNGGEPPRPPEAPREHETGVFDSSEEPGKVLARCRCGWSGPAGTNTVTASRQGKDHERNPLDA